MNAKTNLIVDGAIFALVLVAFEPSLTGIAIHEWLSLGFASALLVHLLLHWEWTVAVTKKFFNNLFHSSRLNYILNALLLVVFVAVILSGLMISKSILPALGLQADRNQVWRFLHSSSTDAFLLLIGLHVALHWKWILSTGKRYLVQPVQKRLGNFAPRPAIRPAGRIEPQTMPLPVPVSLPEKVQIYVKGKR